jgi:hypothetical protein
MPVLRQAAQDFHALADLLLAGGVGEAEVGVAAGKDVAGDEQDVVLDGLGDEGGGGEMEGGDLEGGDLEMGEEGGELEGGAEEDEEGEEDEDEFKLEHRADERKLLLEMARQQKRQRRVKLVEKLHNRKGRPSNPFQNLLESKELDGLNRDTKAGRQILRESTDVLELNESTTLISWSVPKEDRDTAIMEVAKALALNTPDTIAQNEDITEDDLPG